MNKEKRKYMKHLVWILVLVIAVSCNKKEEAPDFKIEFGKVAFKSVFSGGDSLSIWGGSVVKGDDGHYHMLYSRWPKNNGFHGHHRSRSRIL